MHTPMISAMNDRGSDSVYMLCVPGYDPMQSAIYVFMLVDMFMLCYVMLR